MTKTYQEIFDFLNVANNYIKEHEKENTKFNWALQRMTKRLEKTVTTYNERMAELNIEHCSVDEKGNILENARGLYVYNKEELRKRNKAQSELAQQAVDIEPYIATGPLPELKFSELVAFTGFVLEEPKEEGVE